jgi:hypothetical protein
VAFTPDGSRFVIASKGGGLGFIQICDSKTGRVLLTLPHYDRLPMSRYGWEDYQGLTFSRDGNLLAVTARDSKGKDVLTIWDARPLD